MIKNYTHALNEEVASISGRYEIVKEERMKCRDRELLYLVGSATVDNACCGTGQCHYAVVPGFIVRWKRGTDETGLPVSEIEPIVDETERHKIRKAIEKIESVNQVEFW